MFDHYEMYVAARDAIAALDVQPFQEEAYPLPGWISDDFDRDAGLLELWPASEEACLDDLYYDHTEVSR